MFKIEEPTVYYKTSEKMEELDNNSIQLIITSPPYGKIKDYGVENQIGFYDNFEDYFGRLKNVWSECYRVLEPQCRMVINIGDQYLRTAKFGRYRILSIASRIIDDCLKLGFDYLGDIIWQKISSTSTTGGCSLMGSIYYPRNGLLTYDYEHILIFKKFEGKKKKVSLQIKELSKISLSEWKKWYIGHWRFPGVIQKEHVAMFPEELPYRIIRMFSFIGDIVLDPFAGSGTTLKVAKSLFRRCIGYEINEDFKPIIESKIELGKDGFFIGYQFLLQIIYQKSSIENFRIVYEKQKQKGIIILKNNENTEIIVDYILFDENFLDKENILREFKSKFEENTFRNYLKEKVEWNHYKNYVIIINSKSLNSLDILELGEKLIEVQEINKKTQLVSIEDVVSSNFKLNDFFQFID